jgi:hypothetical protein
MTGARDIPVAVEIVAPEASIGAQRAFSSGPGALLLLAGIPWGVPPLAGGG